MILDGFRSQKNDPDLLSFSWLNTRAAFHLMAILHCYGMELFHGSFISRLSVDNASLDGKSVAYFILLFLFFP